MATSYTWNGGFGSPGSWSNPSEWSPFAVPGAADSADVSGGSVVVGGAQAIDMLFASTGTFEVASGASFTIESYASFDGLFYVPTGAVVTAGPSSTPTYSSLSFGDQAGGTGSLFVDGGALTADTLVFVGYAGTGSATVVNGGSLTLRDGTYALVLGALAGAAGLVTIGGASQVTALGEIDVGASGYGALSLQDGGRLTSSAASGSSVAAFVGGDAGSAGSNVTISGPGSEWDAAGGVELFGKTTLTVEGGGVLGQTATLSAVYGLSAGNIAASSADTSVILVTGAGSMVNTGTSSIGLGYDAVGVMFVEQGAHVLATAPATYNALTLGETASGAGFLTISDVGSTVTLLGQAVVGRAGYGNLTVQAGATLGTGGVDGNQGVEVGASLGAVGILTVTGPGSTLVNSGLFWVGSSGTGTLVVTGGGVVTSTRDPANGGALSIAHDAGGKGTVVVSGAGSRFVASGDVYVGDHGTGTLFVEAGGSVAVSGTLYAGTTTAAVGVVVVGGAGSAVSIAGDLDMGLGAGGGGSWYLQAVGGGRVDVLGGAFLSDGAVLSADAASVVEIGGAGAAIGGGTIEVAAAGSLSGAGMVVGALDDLGLVSANLGGRLVLQGTASGGRYDASGGGTLVFAGALGGAVYMSFGASGGGGGTVELGTGVSTLVSSAGPGAIVTGAGQAAVLFIADGNSVVSQGRDTVVAGAGAETVALTGADALLFGGAATLSIASLGQNGTVVGGAQGVTLLGATGSGVVFGSTSAVNALTTATGPTTLVGGSSGDVLTANNASGDLLIAGAGAETLGAAAATGFVTMLAGGGADSLHGGAGTTLMLGGAGDASMTGGSGANIYGFIDGLSSGGSDTITAFDASHELVVLYGYGAGEGARALAGGTVQGGSLVLSLSDGTHITFQGLTSLSSGSLIG